MKNSILHGVYLYGALYIAGVFAAGLMLAYHGAMYLALITAGSAYVSQIFAFLSVEDYDGISVEARAHVVFWAVTLFMGIAAGLSLLLGW